MKIKILSHPTNRNPPIKIMLRKLFAPKIQRIECIRAVRSVLKQVFFRFRILLGAFS